MKKLHWIFIIFSICLSVAHSQTSNIDSLKECLRTLDVNDTNKVNLLHKIGYYYSSTSTDTAMKYANQEIELAKELKFQRGIAQSYLLIGMIYQYKNIYEDALKYYLLSLKTSEQTGDKKAIASAMVGVGLIYQNTGDTQKSIDYYMKALKIREEINDKPGIMACLNNLSGLYYYRGDRKKAKEYIFRCLKIGEEIGNKNGIAASLNGIASISLEEGDLPKALEYFQKALQVHEKINNGYDVAMVSNNIGQVYFKMRNYKEALNWYEKSLSVSQKYNILELAVDAKEGLSQVYEKIGNYKLAYRYHKEYSTLKDSMLTIQTHNQILEMGTKYESEKKEKEIELLNKDREKQTALTEVENRKNNIIIWSVALGLIFTIIFSGFLFNRFRVTKKQKAIIEAKEKETQHQKHLVDEKNKEITDSITYAKRLQEAILPSQEYINHYLPESFVLYKPKDIVAGDFYWMEKVDNLIFIAAADSTGHGVPGAMVSVVCSNALNRTINELGLRDTGKILDKTRELVLATFAKSINDVKDGMDISLLCIDKTKKRINWSGANNPLWYIQNNELKEIKADKQSIGKTDNPKPFTTHEIDYTTNMIFYLFTDGFADQFGGEKGKKYKYKQLADLLLTINNESLEKQKNDLENSFNLWMGNLEQVDDVTIIGFKI